MGEMALDSHGRVLRRPAWVSAGEVKHLNDCLRDVRASRDNWKEKYCRVEMERDLLYVDLHRMANKKTTCRRRLIPVVKFLLNL